MANELFCPTHGPYDAVYGSCPYCSGDYKRPAPPPSLNEDDMETDFGYGRPAAPAGGARVDSELPTEIGPSRQQRRFLDDDEEVTNVVHRERDDVTELEFEPKGMLGILWVKEGRRRGKIYPIEDDTVVGRKSGDLILDDPKVSNPHAKFKVEEDQFVVWDFGSKNGTYVNGERIRDARTLKENDTIKIGDSTFVVKVLS